MPNDSYGPVVPGLTLRDVQRRNEQFYDRSRTSTSNLRVADAATADGYTREQIMSWRPNEIGQYYTKVTGNAPLPPSRINSMVSAILEAGGPHEDSVKELAQRIRAKVRELKADGVVQMTPRDLSQLISTSGLRFANPNAFERGFNEALSLSGVGNFVR